MGGSVLSAAMIAWAQSQIDGIPADKYKNLAEGLTWRWNGDPLPLAGRPGALLLTEATGPGPRIAEPPAPAARNPHQTANLLVAGPEHGSAFVVTDGERVYSGLPVMPGGVEAPLLVFHDGVPPQATDLKILQAEPALLAAPPAPERPELLCFTPGAGIETEAGTVKIEDLSPGDRVVTRDNGLQEVAWIGHRRMTGARLFALPAERPVRIRAGALGRRGPAEDLLVSPDHKILIDHPGAKALWGEAEVLVRASDLLGAPGVTVDPCLTGTHYVNLMFEGHEVIRADGLEVESFHPGFAGPGSLGEAAKKSLAAHFPDLARDPHRFGPPVRRVLSLAEAQIVAHHSPLAGA